MDAAPYWALPRHFPPLAQQRPDHIAHPYLGEQREFGNLAWNPSGLKG